MKFSSTALVVGSCLLSAATAFTPPARGAVPSSGVVAKTTHFMFSGAGEGIPGEDDPEEFKKMEQAAKAMGMTVDEYQLGLRARLRLAKELDNARVRGGKMETVGLERDANNPPKTMEITITESGKALGPDGVSKAVCAALKQASDEARKVRGDSQKRMMQFISDEMKGMGRA